MAEATEREIAIAEEIDRAYTRASETAETIDEAEHRCIALLARRLAEYREELGRPPEAPVPMLLWCPCCLARHIDVDAFATKPHHTHACQHCGNVWRPAIIPTVGVRFLPGFKDVVLERPSATSTPGLVEAYGPCPCCAGAGEMPLVSASPRSDKEEPHG